MFSLSIGARVGLLVGLVLFYTPKTVDCLGHLKPLELSMNCMLSILLTIKKGGLLANLEKFCPLRMAVKLGNSSEAEQEKI